MSASRVLGGARRINAAGEELIKSFEGFSAGAYRCSAGRWTIGYGHTKTAVAGMKVTREQAVVLLRQDLREAEAAVIALVKVPLNDNEFSALVSFTFNLGRGALARSALLRNLNAGDKAGVPAQMLRWVNSGGVFMPGLLRRRTAEGDLWRTE